MLKALSFVFSTKMALVLLLLLATAMAVATFVENDFGTPTARAWFYEAWWFELLLLWLSVNFLLHLSQYQMLNKFSWPIGMFHLAFILILIGAGVTRYFSTEGLMHLREGQTNDTFFTQNKYLQLQTVQGNPVIYQQPFTLIPQGFKPFEKNIGWKEESWKVQFKGFYPKAVLDPQPGNKDYFEIAVALGQDGREDVMLEVGETVTLKNQTLSLNANKEGDIQIYKRDSTWIIKSKVALQMMEMATQKMSFLHAGEEQVLFQRTLYQWEGGAFVVKQIHEQIQLHYQSNEEDRDDLPDIIHFSLLDSQGKELVEHFVKMVSFQSDWKYFEHEGTKYKVTFGSKPIVLPFALQLKKFELERYPGSQSPSSYASQVQVIDGDEKFPYRIFMNNVLDYLGFRFYQSSYDTDEKGSVLSINQDRPGTILTYLGYFFLSMGMFLAFFSKTGRLRTLNRQLQSLQKTTVILLLLMSTTWAVAQTPSREMVVVPDDLAKNYGTLIVQDIDGRMKPLNTLANEITRKIHGKSTLRLPGELETLHLTAEQFLLALQLDPQGFMLLPIIKNDHRKLSKVYEVISKKPTPYLAFQDLVDREGGYLIQALVEEANRLKPSERNESHNEILKLDERFNVFYGLITGDFLRIFPNRNDTQNTWFTMQQSQQGFEEEDAYFVQNITPMFLTAIENGLEKQDFSEAVKALDYLHLYQQKAGAEVYPSATQISAELLYNRLQIGNRLFGLFWILGILLLVVALVKIFKESKILEVLWNFGALLSWLGLLLFTFHLLLRWYIAKHPPWSDGFEMLVFVAWGVLLFGIAFSKKSKFTLPMGLLFSGTLLFVGFLDWLNPEITNLMPVLHSYWLKIHVAVIVSGYAPLALSAVLGLLSLLLLLFKPKHAPKKWLKGVKELVIVNEMAMMIGLFLLTVGTFLGGVWANESWGRYWAWDPKETWALISIIVYAIILHFRLIPALRNVLLFNIVSLWGFSTIVMTSFGVNYYLSGLHSYAKGDPVPVPTWVYYTVFVLLIITFFAIYNYKKLPLQEKQALN
ncbi:cytochrome c biogenesis protein [Flavobacterium sp. UBA6135]|uniref:cytochrome c biogenesis protein n=1 Tax=Flavobacterium sp. UBA6135 TaxID=1946553 RepID=UPI0025C24B06|nr:cytochrome c biogenesis protein CcsA [Flavobacterium sp. UBA6135]